ncbi:MAG: transglutaminase-like domain-containing protein [Nanoarchaeota archaeon]|nr:transglutaminase-like domain-containing protein [Nanoarchaeota archaeon]
MKKCLLLIAILLFPFVLAEENLYEYDSLDIDIDINSGFELIATGGNARVEEVSTTIYLFPQESSRQHVLSLDSSGEEQQNQQLFFTWNNPAIGTHSFGYSAKIKTNAQRMEVHTKIPFPLSPQQVSEVEKYLEPTATIDSNNPAVIAKATELVEGEDDLFKAVFNLANWVDNNVEYDLTTLNAETAQKASWVLQHKNGVCDEMTSLFVAMARAVGIPARFVSGVSYTTSPLFSEPWQSHGWAEVYFPEVGWVSFDIAFGEYGYIDVTHVKLRDGFDPVDPATRYEWLAHNVELKTKQLEIDTSISQTGNILAEELELEQEILAPEIDIGSYNMVKGIIKNKANYYAATTLRLAVPTEVEVMGKNKRTILLAPNEVKETIWIIKVSDDLNQDYVYTFPALIWSEKNVSVEDSFKAQTGKTSYSKEDIEEFNIEVEDKTYSRKVSFKCDLPPEIRLGESADVTCTIKNIGNTNVENLNFCIENVCERINLPINQEHTGKITVEGKIVGWNKIRVTAENSLIQKSTSLQYMVSDEPKITFSPEYPQSIAYGADFSLNMNLHKESFANPQKVVLEVDSFAGESSWEMEELVKDQNIVLEMDSQRMSGKNTIKINVVWEDTEGKKYSEKREIVIVVTPTSFGERMRMWMNAVMNLFT